MIRVSEYAGYFLDYPDAVGRIFSRTGADNQKKAKWSTDELYQGEMFQNLGCCPPSQVLKAKDVL